MKFANQRDRTPFTWELMAGSSCIGASPAGVTQRQTQGTDVRWQLDFAREDIRYFGAIESSHSVKILAEGTANLTPILLLTFFSL